MKDIDCFCCEIRLKEKVFESRKGAACLVQVTVTCYAEGLKFMGGIVCGVLE